MKRLFLFSALFLAGVFAVNAQDVNKPQTSANVGMAPIQKGNWMIGGNLGGLGYAFENKSFNLSVNPTAGYFISDGVALGLGLIGTVATAKNSDTEWGYGVAPFIRYFFPQGSSASGRFFAHGDVGIQGSSLGSGASLALGANVGYAHFITNSVALEAAVGYDYSKATISGATGKSGLGVSLGFQIYLPGQR